MKTERTEQILNFCCEMGRQLIQNGAEIYRVEDSINRLLTAYGYEDTEVFAIPSCVILNIQDGGHNYTKSIRIRSSFINLDKLERLNSLCRRVCRDRPAPREAFARLEEVTSAASYPQYVSYLAHGFVAVFFTLFWGGTLLDACLAFFCGAAVKASVGYLSRYDTNIFFTYVCSSMAMVLLPLALSYLGVPIHMDKMVIGAIMLLVPGIAITNVMRDVIAGDFLTALTKFAEVLIIAMALAVGIAIPVGLARFFWGVI
ncbi:threonine/serine exporter ThrE family protein [uncultured Oscillibacter sp.]|uniref:threonine/serine ThrE exporter family protein n=1 Tax=uncultured Oscillibacter sp. TaxID=876091 RepID=UPI0025F16A4F|nr:threonine/serine exporter family protein [uncultured Oscillibacter sp.]